MKRILYFSAILIMLGCGGKDGSGVVTPNDPPVPDCECQPQIVARGVLFLGERRIDGFFVDQDCDPRTRPIFLVKNK